MQMLYVPLLSGKYKNCTSCFQIVYLVHFSDVFDDSSDLDEDDDAPEVADEDPLEPDVDLPSGIYVRSTQKKNSCFFCYKRVKVLWRHIKTSHPDEDEVRELLKVKDTSEKTRKISLLRYRGNFEHNKRVKEKGRGELIVGRQTSDQYKAADFLPCPHCLQYVLRSALKRHRIKSCLVSRGRSDEEGTKRIVFDSMLLTNEVGKSGRDAFEAEILSRMTDGEVKRTIYNDPLIMKFGSTLHEKLGVRGFNQISQRLRAIASFLQLSTVGTMMGLIAPVIFCKLVKDFWTIRGVEPRFFGLALQCSTSELYRPSTFNELSAEFYPDYS